MSKKYAIIYHPILKRNVQVPVEDIQKAMSTEERAARAANVRWGNEQANTDTNSENNESDNKKKPKSALFRPNSVASKTARLALAGAGIAVAVHPATRAFLGKALGAAGSKIGSLGVKGKFFAQEFSSIADKLNTNKWRNATSILNDPKSRYASIEGANKEIKNLKLLSKIFDKASDLGLDVGDRLTGAGFKVTPKGRKLGYVFNTGARFIEDLFN